MTGCRRNTGFFDIVTSRICIIDVKNTTKRRRKYLDKVRKKSAFCMLLLALLAVSGITLEIVKICEIRAERESLDALYNDTVLLEGQVDNKRVELEMETREAVICQRASKTLGMITPEQNQVITLPFEFSADNGIHLASAGIQN